MIFVDRLDQNITTLEHVSEGEWKIRSMNPATTGMHAPPYAQETPLGMYLLQQKKTRMVFLKDGSAENATSHSKFVFDWAPTERSLVVVIE